MARIFIFLGALNGLLAVVLGAYASHGLQGRVDDRMVEVFQTAVHYQGVHALALLAVGILSLHIPGSRWAWASGWLFLTGIVLFSGSLYALVLTGFSGLGRVTPIGGLTLLLAWSALAGAALRDLRG